MINWKLRASNPIFWVNVALSIATPILGYYGMAIESFTTWNSIYDVVLNAVQNPYVVGLMAVSLWNTVINPTTKGVRD